ncbi:MAG: transglutaminase family protein [Pegethrix bostrychoides GSE-TBD4-15B]|uniref:Transglutaminase family protein n=1 Tax=Pegethrix bostrychoides GSE-TBD4-15B TaxID=2839662 RepID=A0A951PB97_9CYAN|nr:transglutaminase family protein [Pegethrix bostrychoides GSE-TBD4-15B]
MHYQITHRTIYSYDRPVVLAPHYLQLRPRSDVTQKLHQFQLEIDPLPKQLFEALDLGGNLVSRAMFGAEGVTQLVIQAMSQVETFRSNPFDYLLEPWALSLPINYPILLHHQLQPYLGGQFAGGQLAGNGSIDPVAMQLAQELWMQTSGSVVGFLSELNQIIYQNCRYGLRETGKPYPPGITWTQKTGSCRDYTVLFMEVCRAAGLASRFVSGYQEGDPDSDDRHLHAWAEVYLPGAGWRGYDPTQGLAVADRHIALVAPPTAKHSAPVSGTLKTTGAQSQMSYELKIRLLD